MKIDANQNDDGNTCTLHVAPDMFCQSQGGFWNTVFINVWVSIAVVFIGAMTYNLYSAITSEDRVKISTFGLLLIALASSYEVADIGLDIR